jgi:hypothetical protein
MKVITLDLVGEGYMRSIDYMRSSLLYRCKNRAVNVSNEYWRQIKHSCQDYKLIYAWEWGLTRILRKTHDWFYCNENLPALHLKDSVRTAQETRNISIIKSNLLTLYAEITFAVYETRKNHRNALWGQSVEYFLMWSFVVHKVTTELWRDTGNCSWTNTAILRVNTLGRIRRGDIKTNGRNQSILSMLVGRNTTCCT